MVSDNRPAAATSLWHTRWAHALGARLGDFRTHLERTATRATRQGRACAAALPYGASPIHEISTAPQSSVAPWRKLTLQAICLRRLPTDSKECPLGRSA